MTRKRTVLLKLISFGIVFLLIYLVFNKDQVTGSKNISKFETADLDKNGLGEQYNLVNGRLKITQDNKIIWQSPTNWWVDDFVLADATNDDTLDINLSVWKKGNFGPDKPFWVKENDQSIKNHLFIFDLIQAKAKAAWQSSNLEAPNCEFNFTDIDNDGKNELIVTEGVYTDNHRCQDKYKAVWRWNGWGFSNIRRSEM